MRFSLERGLFSRLPKSKKSLPNLPSIDSTSRGILSHNNSLNRLSETMASTENLSRKSTQNSIKKANSSLYLNNLNKDTPSVSRDKSIMTRPMAMSGNVGPFIESTIGSKKIRKAGQFLPPKNSSTNNLSSRKEHNESANNLNILPQINDSNPANLTASNRKLNEISGKRKEYSNFQNLNNRNNSRERLDQKGILTSSLNLTESTVNLNSIKNPVIKKSTNGKSLKNKYANIKSKINSSHQKLPQNENFKNNISASNHNLTSDSQNINSISEKLINYRLGQSGHLAHSSAVNLAPGIKSGKQETSVTGPLKHIPQDLKSSKNTVYKTFSNNNSRQPSFNSVQNLAYHQNNNNNTNSIKTLQAVGSLASSKSGSALSNHRKNFVIKNTLQNNNTITTTNSRDHNHENMDVDEGLDQTHSFSKASTPRKMRSSSNKTSVVNTPNDNYNTRSDSGTSQGDGTHLDLPLGPKAALALFGNILTSYEKKEILDYSEIYFPGLKSAQKIEAKPSGPESMSDLADDQLINFGYDDNTGVYNQVIGDHLDYRYEILSELGAGSFGSVVKCRDHKTDKNVAVKIIRNKKRFHHQALIEIKILKVLKEKDKQQKMNVIRGVDKKSI